MRLLRIAFAGTPVFALPSVQAIFLNPKLELVCVITQPDKQKGRGLKTGESAIKKFSLQNNIPIFQPTSINDPDSLEFISKLSVDFIVVVAFGQILAPQILGAPKFGCINLHASLLPRSALAF